MDDTANILHNRAISISHETEELFRDYRRSVDSMSVALSQSLSLVPFRTSTHVPISMPNTPAKSDSSASYDQNDSESNMNVSGILEKYSDRLLELVSSKIAGKMS